MYNRLRAIKPNQKLNILTQIEISVFWRLILCRPPKGEGKVEKRGRPKKQKGDEDENGSEEEEEEKEEEEEEKTNGAEEKEEDSKEAEDENWDLHTTTTGQIQSGPFCLVLFWPVLVFVVAV